MWNIFLCIFLDILTNMKREQFFPQESKIINKNVASKISNWKFFLPEISLEHMKKIYLFILLAIFVPGMSSAAISSWQKSASMVSRYSTDFGSEEYKQSIRNLKASNINTVSLIVPYFQSTCQSSDIQATGGTPTEASIISGIDYARSQGLNVSLKVHLETLFDGNCAWRANIDASDRAAWFANYGAVLNRLGIIAAAHGVSEIVIGAELIRMSSGDPNITPHAADNSARWKTMIANLRKVFGGKLTYSANWGSGGFATETNQVKFWDSLDTIGISGYYELPSGTDSVADIKTQWDRWNTNNIAPLTTTYNKSFQFTEIGYQSADGARFQPWDYNRKWWAGYDGQEQANLYEALFQYWNNYSYMQGVNLWDWSTDPNVGGQGNTDYTPNKKPAQTVISNYFSGGTTPNPQPPPPPPPTPGTFSSSTTTTGSTVGQSVTVNTNVVSQSAASNLIVDLEVYNSTGQKIEQRFFESQNFTAGQSKPYSLTFTPSASGTYKVAIGVFSAGWTTNYYWNDSYTFNVSSTTTTPPPPPPPNPTPPPPPQPGNYVLNNWWPTDGASLSGVQPFKAMVENLEVASYTMYWQVDGGALVLMPTNLTDYPHKETLVDVNSWTWRGNGPYSVTFIAKDNTGKIIAQKTISISIAR